MDVKILIDVSAEFTYYFKVRYSYYACKTCRGLVGIPKRTKISTV